MFRKVQFKMLFLAFHAQICFHVLWKLSYFDAYGWTSLKHILLSQRWFSSYMLFNKTFMLFIKIFLSMHYDESHSDAQNILMQMWYLWK